MSRNLSPQDIEQLSAYLDDQLAPVERARLEARLAADPALQRELAELKTTVLALRELPTLPVPRNFTLSRAQAVGPAMAKRPWSLPSFTFPALRLATALTAVAFVFVLALDFNLSRQQPRQQLRQQLAATAEVSVAVVEVEKEVSPAEAPVAAEPTLPATEALAESAVAAVEKADVVEEAESFGGGAAAPETPSLALEAPGTPLPAAEGVPGGEGLDASPAPQDLSPAEIETQAQATEPPARLTAAPAATEISTAEAPPGQPAELQPAAAPTNPYRPLTLGLAALTLLLILLTLLARRRSPSRVE